MLRDAASMPSSCTSGTLLVSSFLRPRWNKRRDEYGGTVANRARLAVRILREVGDASPGRWRSPPSSTWSTASTEGSGSQRGIEFAPDLRARGCPRCHRAHRRRLTRQPDVHVPGDAPRKEFEEVLPQLPAPRLQALAPVLFRRYPFEEAYFLPWARPLPQQLSLPVILLGGINTSASINQAMAEGFGFVRWAGRCSESPTSSPGCVTARRPGHLHPLQQVHGQHLQRHEVRPRPPEPSPSDLRHRAGHAGTLERAGSPGSHQNLTCPVGFSPLACPSRRKKAEP